MTVTDEGASLTVCAYFEALLTVRFRSESS
jgi:hypothetical protein